MDVEIFDGERVDDLQCGGLLLIQKKTGFRFGIDAVLLADFADVGKGARVIDLGTGTGVIPVLLAGKTRAREICGIEIQHDVAGMAQRTVRLNGLESRVGIICGDLKDAPSLYGPSSFNVVLSNPPYMNRGAGLVNPDDSRAIARHEIKCTLEDVVAAGARLLAPGGQFALVHRPSRLVDIVWLMRKYVVEPKYVRFVHPSPYRKPNLVLIKGCKGGNPELKMMAPLYVYDEEGKYTREIDEIYGKGNAVCRLNADRQS